VDADAAAADLGAVQDEVVGPGPRLPGVRVQERQILRHGGGEGVVLGHESLFRVAVLEQRELDDPCERELIGLDEIEPAGHVDSQVRQRVIDDSRGVGDEDDQVALAGLHGPVDGLDLFGPEELHDGRGPSVGVDAGPGEPPGAVVGDEVRQPVDVLAGEPAVVLDPDGLDNPAACSHLVEHLEPAVLHDLRYVPELHAEAGVGVVSPVSLHGVPVGDPREGGLELPAHARFEDVHHEAFHRGEDVSLVDEGHFHVDLGELGLAVRAEILVAEAPDDLEVAVEARDHQKLFEGLRGLGQGVERARVDATGDEVVPGALGGALCEHGRLDLEEPPGDEVLPCGRSDAASQDDVSLEFGPAKVEIAVLEADALRDLRFGIENEGGCLRLAEDLEGVHHQLDAARGKIGVRHALGPPANRPLHGEDELASDPVRLTVRIGLDLGVKDDLSDPLAVPQVDEDDPAVVAAAVHPSHQDYFVPGIVGRQAAAVVSSFPSCDEVRQGVFPPFSNLLTHCLLWSCILPSPNGPVSFR